jgi:hypothetical protein
MPNNVVRRDPLNAQGFRTQRPESPEDLWQPLYDRVNYPANGLTNQLAFYAVPKGQAATLIRAGVAAPVNKTYRDTNIENANVVPTKLFKFVGASWGFSHLVEGAVTNPTDRDRLRCGGYFKFRIVDKDLLYLPAVSLPEINPYIIASTTVNATTILGAAGGGGSNVPMYRFPVPITLNPYENFTVEFNTDGVVVTNSTVDIILILHAFMRRPT